jgi:hypothetical protein
MAVIAADALTVACSARNSVYVEEIQKLGATVLQAREALIRALLCRGTNASV